MHTFKLGKQTQLVKKVQFPEALLTALQNNIEIEKQKKEAEAAKERQLQEQQLKKEKAALANKVSLNKQNTTKLALKANEYLDKIVRCYVNDLDSLKVSVKNLDKGCAIFTAILDWQECILDLDRKTLYKFETFEHITRKNLLGKLSKLEKGQQNQFEPLEEFDTFNLWMVFEVCKISGGLHFSGQIAECVERFFDAFFKHKKTYFPCRTKDSYGMYVVDGINKGINYLNSNQYDNVILILRRDPSKSYDSTLGYLIGEKILPILEDNDKVFSKNGLFKDVLEQFELGLGEFFKDKNYLAAGKNFLLINEEKFRQSLYSENETAIRLVSSYTPVREIWKNYQEIKAKINEINAQMETDRKLQEQQLEQKPEVKKEKTLSEAEKIAILEQGLEKFLLESDYKRAHLAPFAKECLTDIKQGHWDLVEMQGEKGTIVNLKQSLVARPPQLDVDVNMVCGIDFGTKSTVVACRRETDSLLRVGCGKLDKVPEPKDYENPTVLEFIDLEGFKEAYLAKSGRPFTEWKQVKAAHGAEEDLLLKKDQDAYKGQASFVGDLKQWAGDKDHRISIGGKLKSYLELKDGDLDPVEIYAYYLGLYINRMLKGICLHYALSFPVTFSEEAKKHLVSSFRKGLWKSIPELVQKEADVAKLFKVYAAVSEPAAYAACMFKSNKELLPKKTDVSVSYGVFDFGGGTTDFDFGILNKVENPDGRSSYLITHFGSRGDQYLGGENLLAQIGYEIYRENWHEMLAKKIPIILPENAQGIAGLETLVQNYSSYSSCAYANVKLLSEALRGLWERPEEKAPLNAQGRFEISLWNTNNKLVKLNLSLNLEKINNLLETRVKDGVENFFQSLRATRLYEMGENGYKHLPIHIFLAGNSCKSSILQKAFEERKLAEEVVLGNTEPENSWLIIHPLPSGECDPQQYATSKTGKTGVAFGLLECYRGARRFVVKSEEDYGFKYYLGILDDDDEFKVLLSPDKVNEWQRYVMLYDDEDGFELHYSSEPRSMRNQGMNRGQVKRAYCSFENVQANVQLFVWLRKKSPTSLEYSIGTESEHSLGSHSKIYEIDLSVR